MLNFHLKKYFSVGVGIVLGSMMSVALAQQEDKEIPVPASDPVRIDFAIGSSVSPPRAGTAEAISATKIYNRSLRKPNEVDVWAFCIDGNFTATVDAYAGDSMLFLFDANGSLLTSDDDSFGSLRSYLSSTASGIVYLAMSNYRNIPMDANGNGWDNMTGPVVGWDGGAGSTSGAYQLTVTGIKWLGACLLPFLPH
jgi:hypothetical protein